MFDPRGSLVSLVGVGERREKVLQSAAVVAHPRLPSRRLPLALPHASLTAPLSPALALTPLPRRRVPCPYQLSSPAALTIVFPPTCRSAPLQQSGVRCAQAAGGPA